jgi:beta-phosphoglucomutase-like phosphatase (HAD superfamily)
MHTIFGVFPGEENVPATKPDPRELLQACTGLGALPENCWYIGDGKPDDEAAKAGVLKSGLVSWGTHPRTELDKPGIEKLFDEPRNSRLIFLMELRRSPREEGELILGRSGGLTRCAPLSRRHVAG